MILSIHLPCDITSAEGPGGPMQRGYTTVIYRHIYLDQRDLPLERFVKIKGVEDPKPKELITLPGLDIT